MKTTEIKLSDKVRDTITGYKGVAIAITHWLNGCTRVTIQPQELKDGVPIESKCFDIEQLEVVETAPVKEEKPSGGPRPAATRNPDPVR